jgi:hypothetical protein
MYVVVQHRIKNPQAAFSRGQKLVKNEGVPAGVRGLQFYPSRDRSAVTCLWESDSVDAVQQYVDSTLGDASENTVTRSTWSTPSRASRPAYANPRPSSLESSALAPAGQPAGVVGACSCAGGASSAGAPGDAVGSGSGAGAAGGTSAEGSRPARHAARVSAPSP